MADKPVTREEKYLAYLTGDYTGEIPKPITRKEKYLYELCLKGIGGEISPEEIKNAVNEYLEKNPVKPGATTEQAQQIEQNKTDVALLKEETGSLKEDIESIQELDRIYDGVDLSIKFAEEIKKYSDIWQWIKARIKAGNFAGIHVNDFIRWQTTDNKWVESRVAGINTYRRYGDREVQNHIDFISKDLWPTLHTMNPVDYNNGIIPTENLSGDGTKTAFVLTNEMAAVASVTIGALLQQRISIMQIRIRSHLPMHQQQVQTIL